MNFILNSPPHWACFCDGNAKALSLSLCVKKIFTGFLSLEEEEEEEEVNSNVNNNDHTTLPIQQQYNTNEQQYNTNDLAHSAAIQYQ